jgi:hypothetical protein
VNTGSVALPNLNASLRLTDLRVIEELDKHTLFDIRVQAHEVLRSHHVFGTPLLVTLRDRSWAGYLNSVKQDTPGSVRIIGVGVTWSLKNAAQRSWTNATLRRVVKDVCSAQYLNSTVEHEHAFDSVMQASGQSDWAFLNYLAKRAGLRIESHNSGVVLFNPEERFSNPRTLTNLTASATA